MFCEKCGKQIIDGDSFCTGCGNKVTYPSAVHTPKIPENKIQTNMTMEENSKTLAPEISPPKMVKKKSNKGLVITISICAVLLAVLIGILSYLAINGGFDDTDSEKSTTSVTNKEKTKSKHKEKKPPKKPEVNEIDTDTIENYIYSDLDHTDFGVYVYNLSNGYEFGYNEDLLLPASAMSQVVILDTLSQVADDKGLNMETETLMFKYLANGKEAPESRNQDGSMLTLKQCIEDVAVYGDNNKSNYIIDYIGYLYDDSGFNVISDTLKKNGYTNTQINRKIFINSEYIDTSVSPNYTTAKEISKIFNNLINNCSYGSDAYMKNIFKSISNDGEAIGLKKYVPDRFDMCSVNALNSQSTNDVAIISDGEKSIVVAVLSCTDEDYTDIEDNDDREDVQEDIIEYILQTQFED